MTALDDHARLLAVSERWRRLYGESQTEVERLREQVANAEIRENVYAEVERLRVENARLREALDEAEDFRAEIVIEAFTAPDADWGTILDSLRGRIRDLVPPRRHEATGPRGRIYRHPITAVVDDVWLAREETAEADTEAGGTPHE